MGTNFPKTLTTNFKLFNFNNLVVPSGIDFTIDSNTILDNYGLILNNSGKEKFVINGILENTNGAILSNWELDGEDPSENDINEINNDVILKTDMLSIYK